MNGGAQDKVVGWNGSDVGNDIRLSSFLNTAAGVFERSLTTVKLSRRYPEIYWFFSGSSYSSRNSMTYTVAARAAAYASFT